MDAAEVMKWMAYEISIDPEKNKQWLEEIEKERMLEMSDEERAELIKKQFEIACGGK